MAKSLAQRVAATLAKLEKDRAKAEYKAGEPARRQAAGRYAAAVRADRRIDDLINDRCTPRNLREPRIVDYAEFGECL